MDERIKVLAVYRFSTCNKVRESCSKRKNICPSRDGFIVSDFRGPIPWSSAPGRSKKKAKPKAIARRIAKLKLSFLVGHNVVGFIVAVCETSELNYF
jgi:hypothetical protein